MATGIQLIASLVNEVDTLRLPAYIFEGFLHARRGLSELLLAVPAASSDVLVASLSNVVWLGLAAGAKVLRTLMAPDSELGHVTGCFLRQKLPLVILLPSLDFAWYELHNVTALAGNHVGILLDNLDFLVLGDGLLILRS